MLHHIGTVIPSALGDFSKRITSATTVIAGQLSLAVEDAGGSLPGDRTNNNNNPKEEAPEANTSFDPRVLELLRHARPGSSRPSSRLLKQSMLEYGSAPPRSAPLLVPGSPAFTRPWRVRCDRPRERQRQGQGQGQDHTSSGLLPLSSASLASQTTVSFEDSLEDERSLPGSGRIAAGRKKPGMMVRPKGPEQTPTRTPVCSSCFPHLSRETQPLVLPAAQEPLNRSKAGPSIPHHHLPQSSTREASSDTQAAARRSSSLSLVGPSDGLQGDLPIDESPGIGRNHQTEAKTGGCSEERSTINPAGSSQQSITAPTGSPMFPLPQKYTKPQPCTPQKSQGLGKLSGGCTKTATQHVDGGADGGAGNNRGGGSSTSSPDHRGHGEVQQSPAKTTPSTTSRAAGTTSKSLAVDPPLSSSRRPAIAEASRRPTIELDAALSRSSRLPPAPAPLYTSSSTALSERAASSSIASINTTRGGSRSAGNVEAHQIPGRRSLLRDRRTDYAPTSVNETPDGILLPGDSKAGAVSPTSVFGVAIETRSSLRASARSGNSTTPTKSGVGGKGRRESSRKTHHRYHRTRRGTKKKKLQQQQHQQQQPRQSVASSPADPWKSNLANNTRARSSSQQQANAKPEGKGALANNGAASGAGWGGNDQMDLIAATSMMQIPPSGENQSLVGAGGYAHLQRPDTREAFYSAPAEALEGFRPCVSCFDALMRHHKVNGRMDGAAIGGEVSRNFPEAAGDPHVAFFVRWETLDKGLGRYVPQGFMGSFTPRPFRPALAEYAVKAASEDPKFWGLAWAQIPDTRCRVIVISSLEVAQHERDWMRNRHGLLLSFKDSAGRHYQSAIFPETMCKAGWSKEHTIDILFRKAGYWKPRGDFSGVPGDLAPGSASIDAATTSTIAAVAATTTNISTVITDDPAVSRSAVFLRFQTVTHRMNFSKYQRASKKREKT